MPMSSPYEFPSLDYASHREFGEQLQIERMNDAIRKGHSTVTPFGGRCAILVSLSWWPQARSGP